MAWNTRLVQHGANPIQSGMILNDDLNETQNVSFKSSFKIIPDVLIPINTFGMQNSSWLLQHQHQNAKKALFHPKIDFEWLTKLFSNDMSILLRYMRCLAFYLGLYGLFLGCSWGVLGMFSLFFECSVF